MKISVLRIVFPFLILILTLGWSEEVHPPYHLNLSECISKALAKNPSIEVALQDAAIANAKLDQARSGRYPRIEVTNFTAVVPEARGNSFISQDKITDTDGLGPFNRLEVNLVQPIYTFGKLTAYINAALHGLEAEKAKRAKSEGEVVWQVKRLYYALLLNRKLATLLSEAQTNFEKAAKKFEELIDEGDENASLIDFVKLKLGLSEVSSNLIKIEKSTELIHTSLSQILDFAPKTKFNITDKRLTPERVNLQTLDRYTSLMFEHRPEWKQILLGIQAKESLLDAEKKKFYPDVFIAIPFRYAFAPGRDDQKNPFARDEFNFIELGPVLGLRWEYSFGGTKAKIDQARGELKKLFAQRHQANIGLPLQVRKAFLDVAGLQERMKYTRSAMKATRGLITSSAGAFYLGIQDPKELFESYGLYTKANSDFYIAVHDYNLALASLTKIIGMEITELKY